MFIQFTEFWGDGGHKAHKLIFTEAVYDNKEFTRLECGGHVQKQMGLCLRSLKKRLGQTRFDDGKSVGGTAQLTKNKLDKLQVCCRRAIRNDTHDVQQMKNAVMHGHLASFKVNR